MTKASVTEVVRRELCIGCGICELACPASAISISFDYRNGSFSPVIDSDKCTNCGTCLRVCFGANVDYDLDSHASQHSLMKSTTGNLYGCYLGVAQKQEIRVNASSGGVVTAVLNFLINNGEIDGAIVAKMLPGKPIISKSVLAWSDCDIIEAMGSKYCPVLSSNAIKQIQTEKKFAFVGLPCQIFAIKKYAEKNPLIKKSITLYIGLFCGGTPNYNGTQFLLQKYGLPYEALGTIRYRGGGWPGRMLLQIKQKTFIIPFTEYWPIISPWFYLNRCIICASGLNIKADISCGDAWLPEVIQADKQGTSVLCSRTEIGERVLKAAVTEGYLDLRPISKKTFIESQKSMFGFKHLRLSVRLKILSLFMRKHVIRNIIPENMKSVRLNIYFDEFLLLFGRLLASRKGFWPVFAIFRIALKKFNSFIRIFRHSVS